MMSIRQIEQMIERKSYRRLVDRLLDNGRCVRHHVRRRLLQPEHLVGTALGLALQRVCEMSYGPCEIGARIAEEVRGRLAAATDALASPATISEALPAATVALRGLADWVGRDDHRVSTASDDGRDPTIRRALDAVTAVVGGADLARSDPVAVEIAEWQLGRMLGRMSGRMLVSREDRARDAA
ncbi:MAG: hypothetical protein GY715_11990 [Planctomycetes bacterium]|nr:hypothetical protein [Planctomycetota bacterium]